MPPIDPPPEPDVDLFPDHPAQALEWLLVLSAMRIPHTLHRDARSLYIQVTAADAPRARREIEQYERENANWPPPPEPPPVPAQPSGWSAAWVTVMLGVFYGWFGPYSAGQTVLNAAVSHSERIRAGEWWRVFTALTLHADLPHLAANGVATLGLGAAAATAFGGGAAWLGTLLAAGLANRIGATVFQEPRVSLGASTAVFALLGMLTGGAMARSRGRVAAFAPPGGGFGWFRNRARQALGAALGLFALLGAAPHTDVRAHGLGLLCGLPVGLSLEALRPTRIPALLQRLMEMGALLLLMWAWRMALTRAPT